MVQQCNCKEMLASLDVFFFAGTWMVGQGRRGEGRCAAHPLSADIPRMASPTPRIYDGIDSREANLLGRSFRGS